MYITKNYRDFIREFKGQKFPYYYYEIFVKDKTLKLSLYNEFVQTDMKPSFDLFILNYFTQKEINTGIEEANKNIPRYESSNFPIAASLIEFTNFEKRLKELDSEFSNLEVTKNLESKYYSFNLEKTETVEILKKIDITIQDFKEFVLKNSSIDNYFIEAKAFSESIILLLNKLKYENLKNEILEKILNDEENIYVNIEILNNRKKGQNSNELRNKYRSLRRHFINNLNEIKGNYQNFTTPKLLGTETNSAESKLEIKPTFKPEAVQNIFDLLKDFFSEEHQTQLLQILQSGSKSSEPLIFKDNGNRLADAFKQLIEHDFIPGCKKNTLQKWIADNFKYISKGTIKKFTEDYIEKCTSRDDNPCKKPLFSIVKGEIQKV